MSEMEYEAVPEVSVPLVRPWAWDTYGAWCDAFYGSRKRSFFVFGCLFFFLWIMAEAIKFSVFAVGTVVILVIALFAMLWDLASYKHRLRMAQMDALAPYAREVFQHPRDELPPEVA